MRRYGRVDGNHREIVKALRAAGASVLSAAGLGAGAPDLVVGYAGVTFLLEVKRPEALTHALRSLREKVTAERQSEWREKWRGRVPAVVHSIEEALSVIGALRLGRSFVGLELSPEYAEMARRRIHGDAPLLNGQ